MRTPITYVRYAACFVCIATQSFTGEFVVNTTASAVTVCLSDVFTCGRRGFFSNSATCDPQ